MYYLTLFFTTFFACTSAYSQIDITTCIKLDTIISSGIKIDYKDVHPSDVIMKIYKDDVWLFYPNWADNDSIHFVKINLKSHKREKINLYFPSASFKTPNPNIKSFDLNDSALAIIFTNNSFAYFTIKKSNFEFSFIEPLSFSYNQIFVLNKNQVLITNLYNTHPYGNPDISVINLYDCIKKKLVKIIKPNFTAIPFSHFAPNNWLDVNDTKIIFTQTSTYDATCYDFKLNKTSNYSFKEKNWTFADTTYIKGLCSVKPRINAKDLIEMLSPMEDSVSRIEAVYWIGKDKLLVRKIPANNKLNGRQRFYDILELDKSNKWIKRNENITDKKIHDNEVCSKSNFPIKSVEYKNDFTDKYFVKLSTRFYNYEYGKTFDELKKKEESALGKKEPELFIEIFNCNFDAK